MDEQKFSSIWNCKSPSYLPPGIISPYGVAPENVMVADKMVQTRESFEWMINYADRVNPKIVLEIGTGKGVACLFYDAIAGYDGLIITINISDQIDMDVNNIKSECHRLIMDSSTPEALEAVKGILGERQVDFLFIDGEHGLWVEGVHDPVPFSNDFNNYWPLVRSGGVAAFHDCDAGNEIRRTFDR
ncbi:hypothetical protein LCGC14_2553330, partial [marine sediment metagenome]